ncbi:hypothetical protein Tco_1148778 [Tanacetum coccineum]
MVMIRDSGSIVGSETFLFVSNFLAFVSLWDLNKEASWLLCLVLRCYLRSSKCSGWLSQEHCWLFEFLMDSMTLSNSGSAITIESSLCPVCSVCEEDVCHIFFRCDLAQLVLRRIADGGALDPMTGHRSKEVRIVLDYFRLQLLL